MKKKLVYIITVIIIAIIVVAISLLAKYYHGEVLVYGKELTIYQILGDNIDISSAPQLGDYVYKKAKVNSIGSTAHMNIRLNDNEIILIGNRNLIKINNILYVYFEK